MEFTAEEVEMGARGVVVSSRTKLMKLADGSRHIVPIMNSFAPKQLREYTLQEELREESDSEDSSFPSKSTIIPLKLHQNVPEIELTSSNQELCEISAHSPINSLKHLFHVNPPKNQPSTS